MLKHNKSATQRKYKNHQKAYPTFYILCHSLFITCLILLFNKIKQAKETRNAFFFSINILEIQDSPRTSFLRCQLSYFALSYIPLHRYDSFFRFISLLWGDINNNLGLTTVTNNSIPLNTFPFHNQGKITMPSECNSLGCHKAHDSSKWKIFKKKCLRILHLNINSLLPKIDEICFIAKQSNNDLIYLDLSTLHNELDIDEYDLIRLDHSRKRSEVACYIRKSLSYNHQTSFCHNIESI